MRKGEFLKQGKEHKIYKDRDDPTKLIKEPRWYNLAIIDILHFGKAASTVEKNIYRTRKSIAHSNGRVRVADTYVIPRYFGLSYRIWQQNIVEDNSVKDVGATIRQFDEDLADRYDTSDDNFMTHKEIVYNIDPTPNPLTRIVEKVPFIPNKKYRKFLIWRRGFINRRREAKQN